MATILSEIEKKVRLSPNEKAVAQYVSDHIDEIPEMSSRELARRTYTSGSTVLRFVKKLGFKNYNEFKLNIVASLKNIEIADLDIIGNEDYITMVNKLTDLEVQTIERTKDILSMKSLSGACELIRKASYVDFIANDSNAAICQHAAHNFFLIGKIPAVHSSSDSQLFTSLLARKDHVAIIITKYGETRFINDATRKLVERHVPTIAIISEIDGYLDNVCDYSFYGIVDRKYEFLGDIQFYISTKYLLDLMFASVFSRDYEKCHAVWSEYARMYHLAK